MSANSTAAAFLEALDEAPELSAIRGHPTTESLRGWGSGNPPLSLVAAFLDELGRAIGQIVSEHESCDVLTFTSVEHVSIRRTGGVAVRIADCSNARRTIIAAKAAIAMGGEPVLDYDRLKIVEGLGLEPYSGKVLHASAIIDSQVGVDRELVEAVQASGRAVIVGNAHSAWSAARLLLDIPKFRGRDGDPPTITIIHRNPVRLFYFTAADALADGYVFDQDLDVCPRSGRVNRAGGLKGDARALALEVLRPQQNPPPVEMLQIADTARFRATAKDALERAGLILAATGYRARLPLISAADGLPVAPALSESGRVMTSSGRLLSARGQMTEDVLVYGLGTSLQDPVGGEPSSGDRLTSVWLYQHDIADIVLQSLLPHSNLSVSKNSGIAK